ncbi:hypothetical protein BDZ89DRAFT_1223249 [Hymenopellis radicata]|nr:hypothetical protein BDZ89DRAFT_1223249 [Hymenopellis radicata]
MTTTVFVDIVDNIGVSPASGSNSARRRRGQPMSRQAPVAGFCEAGRMWRRCTVQRTTATSLCSDNGASRFTVSSRDNDHYSLLRKLSTIASSAALSDASTACAITLPTLQPPEAAILRATIPKLGASAEEWAVAGLSDDALSSKPRPPVGHTPSFIHYSAVDTSPVN